MRSEALGISVVFLLAAGLGTAQTTRGDIQGRAIDEVGTALPGVTVTLASKSLLGGKSAVTANNGAFKFLVLPPGIYAATFSLVGFQTQQQPNIKVGIDATVRLEVTMIEAFSDEIIVSAESPLVNTSDTTIGIELSQDFYLDLPMDRNYTAVAAVTPGAQDDLSGQTFYGSTGAENAYYIDGVNTTDIERGQQGTVLNFEFVDEVQVKAGSYGAEYGHATGGLINVITKSGGNEFHGDVFGYLDSDALRAPLTGEAEQGSVSDTSKTVGVVRFDYGADLGGYIVKDRLWFFGAYDRVDNRDTNEALEDYGAEVPGAPMAGDQLPWDTTRDLFALKLSWRPGANHSLSASVFGDPTTEEGAWPTVVWWGAGGFAAEPTYYLRRRLTGGTDGAINYDGVFGRNVVLSARYASHNQKDEWEGPGKALTGYFDFTDPFGTAIVPVGWEGVVSGWGSFSEEELGRKQYNADLSWFVGNLAGNHELKLGAEYEDLSVIKISTRSGPVGATVGRFNCIPEPEGSHYCGDNNEHQYFYRYTYWTSEDINPEQATPEDTVKRRVVDTPTENFAVYLQDRWQVAGNLGLDLGVRWSRQKLYNGGGTVQMDIDDNLAPRLGFVWDFLGNGKSKIFGHWGRFYESIPMDIVIRAFGGGSLWVRAYNFSGDQWDIAQPPEGEAPRRAQQGGQPGGFARVDPNTRGQYMSEAVLGAEYEVSPNVAIGLTFIHRSLDRILEDALAPDGGFYIGNPGEGLMTHSLDMAFDYAYPGGPAECPGDGVACHIKEIPAPRREFDAVELAVNKRFSNNFQFVASIVWSRLEGNYDGNFQASTGQFTPNLNSAYDYADFSVNNDGLLSNDRPWQLKFDGIYRFDFGLTTGLSAYYRSGTPMTAMGFSSLYSNWEYYLSRRGVFGRTDHEWEANLHFGYPVRLGGRFELNLLLDIFNVFNRQGETSRSTSYDWITNGWEDYQPLDWSTGEPLPPIVPGDADRPPLNPAWNTSDRWQDPRTIRLGVRLSF